MCAVYVCINDNRKELMATKKAQAPEKAQKKPPVKIVPAAELRQAAQDLRNRVEIEDIDNEIGRLHGSSVDTTNGLLFSILRELVLARLAKK